MKSLCRIMLFFALAVYMTQGVATVRMASFTIDKSPHIFNRSADGAPQSSHCKTKQVLLDNSIERQHQHHAQFDSHMRATPASETMEMDCCDGSCPMLSCYFSSALMSYSPAVWLTGLNNQVTTEQQIIPNPPLKSLYRPPNIA